ncbi:MAG: hypothetical protein BRC29_03340 [Nanohaloarchaea archaeon SW_7_43_1]|nr:MAG: hypothetical protein BRC29_03340 [Nanohaloarchaea archaeon SW_7_43_1]
MSELIERVQDLESNDGIPSYTSEIVDIFETAEGWKPSTPGKYDRIVAEVEENLENLLDKDGQNGYQVILSYDNHKEDTDAALNLQFPDVRNDKMLTGTLNYRFEPALAGFQDEISRVNRKAAGEAIPEDATYVNQIPEDLSEKEIVSTGIIRVSAPAFDLRPGKLSEDLETLGRTVDKLDQFYEEEMESALKKSAREFVSDEKDPSDKGVFIR